MSQPSAWSLLKNSFKSQPPSPEDVERKRRRFLKSGQAELALNRQGGGGGEGSEQSTRRRRRVSRPSTTYRSSPNPNEMLPRSADEKSEAYESVQAGSPTIYEEFGKHAEPDEADQEQNQSNAATPNHVAISVYRIMERPRMQMGTDHTGDKGQSELVPKVGQGSVDLNKRLPEIQASEHILENLSNAVELPLGSQSVRLEKIDSSTSIGQQVDVQPQGATIPGGHGNLPTIDALSSPSAQEKTWTAVSLADQDLERAVAMSLVPQDACTAQADNRNPNEVPIIQASSPTISEPPVVTALVPENESNGPANEDNEFDEGLDKIYRYLSQVKIEHPNIPFETGISNPCSLTQIEMAMQSLIKAYSTISLTSFDLKDTIKNQAMENELLKTNVDDLNRQIKSLIEDAKALETETARNIGRLEGSILTHEKREEKFEAQMRKIQLDYEAKEKALIKENGERTTALIRKHELQTNKLTSSIDSLRDEHNDNTSALKIYHQDQMSKASRAAAALLIETKQKLETALFREGEAHSTTKMNYTTRFDTMKKDYERKLSDMFNQHDAEKKAMQTRFSDKKKEMDATLAAKKIEHEKFLRTATEDHRQILAQTQENHTRIMEAKNREISDLKNIHLGQTSSLNEEFERRLELMRVKLDQATKEKSQEITSLKVAHEKALQDSNMRLQEELNRVSFQLQHIRQENSEEILGIRNKHASDVKAADRRFQLEMDSLTMQRDQLLFAKDEEIKTQKARFEAAIVKLKDDHKIDKLAHNRALQLSNQALTKALVGRDHFSVMSDNEVSRRFQDINSEIDQLARVPWDKSREQSWPFPPSSFSTSENRRSKKNIIGNTLWVVLYEYIFCTPFRVLGKEGRLLEQEWVKKFGQDHKHRSILCPPATKASETWRYENMVTCVKATDQNNVTESSYAIKTGYQNTLQECANQLIQEIEFVASIRPGDKQRVSELVKSMAELWLEVGQQRSRLFFLLSESDKAPQRSSKTALGRDRAMNLVVVPELRRLGNDQGEQLDIEELVMECKGEFSLFQAA